MEREPGEVTRIDYAPAAKRGRRDDSPLALGCGGLIAAFGAMMLWYGTGGIAWVVYEWKKIDDKDVFEVAMFVVLGLVCAGTGYRWIAAGIRGIGRGGGAR